MIPLEEAQQLLWTYPLPAPAGEGVPLLEAQGRVLGEDLAAPYPLPPFDRSPLDGYALRGEDTLGASRDNPKGLKVVEEIPAGYWGKSQINPGQCARIFTGAPIPQGANAVLRQEDTALEGEWVKIFAEVAPGMNIGRAGEDVAAEELVLTRGTLIGPGEMAMLAALGYDPVPCYRRPKVALLATGDELVGVQSPMGPGQIRNSNLYWLAGAVARDGAQPLILGTVRDDLAEVKGRLQEGLAQADVVITTGGVSVGDYDVVKEAHAALGARRLFWKVAMKPGTPMTAAALGPQLLIGLSGNPAAAAVTYELTVRTLLRQWAGRRDSRLQRVRARLMEGFAKARGQRRFLRGRLEWAEEGYRLWLSGKQDSGVMKSLLACNCLFEVPAHETLSQGDWVEVWLV